MSSISDDEFGEITIRRSSLAKSIKLSQAPNGTLRLSMPNRTPLLFAKRFIAASRDDIRRYLHDQRPVVEYENGSAIGKSHHLEIVNGTRTSVSRDGLRIIVTKQANTTFDDPELQRLFRAVVIKALRIEAKSYLPRRLSFLAQKHGFTYSSVRFSHASSRWGSCSSTGTISLNIALMKLDFDVIDYVLVHELAHTKEMNHSNEFWEIVASIDSQYITHRKNLKKETPSL